MLFGASINMHFDLQRNLGVNPHEIKTEGSATILYQILFWLKLMLQYLKCDIPVAGYLATRDPAVRTYMAPVAVLNSAMGFSGFTHAYI